MAFVYICIYFPECQKLWLGERRIQHLVRIRHSSHGVCLLVGYYGQSYLQVSLFTLIYISQGFSIFSFFRNLVERVRTVIQEAARPKNLYPNYLNPKTGKWGQQHTSMGALGDSFYEYLLKEWLRSGKKDRQVRDWSVLNFPPQEHWKVETLDADCLSSLIHARMINPKRLFNLSNPKCILQWMLFVYEVHKYYLSFCTFCLTHSKSFFSWATCGIN